MAAGPVVASAIGACRGIQDSIRFAGNNGDAGRIATGFSLAGSAATLSQIFTPWSIGAGPVRRFNINSSYNHDLR